VGLSGSELASENVEIQTDRALAQIKAITAELGKLPINLAGTVTGSLDEITAAIGQRRTSALAAIQAQEEKRIVDQQAQFTERLRNKVESMRKSLDTDLRLVGKTGAERAREQIDIQFEAAQDQVKRFRALLLQLPTDVRESFGESIDAISQGIEQRRIGALRAVAKTATKQSSSSPLRTTATLSESRFLTGVGSGRDVVQLQAKSEKHLSGIVKSNNVIGEFLRELIKIEDSRPPLNTRGIFGNTVGL